MSSFDEWKAEKRKIYESMRPYSTEFDVWLSGYVTGMARAAEIESDHHEQKSH